jgi:hypothetical protein
MLRKLAHANFALCYVLDCFDTNLSYGYRKFYHRLLLFSMNAWPSFEISSYGLVAHHFCLKRSVQYISILSMLHNHQGYCVDITINNQNHRLTGPCILTLLLQYIIFQ